ncbi:UDP-N-acetylmuramoylalanine--D-glutamate ligase [Klebsiella pneumoniae IS43]|uniref:UDP-N-acetylmuramoylalanine--D-glutamate ligase n=1 Tax=Klebsiella pneumoniae IS43 TaxID=1432552 RepID=W1DQ38_KLEPN|nr:UDP-N-acetylmuramoylalanine--D-glutamate ligase [Klebsiella pneumoniae IS43]
MADYQGKKVVIIGLGMTGLSCVDFFHGARRNPARDGHPRRASGAG